MHKRRHSFFTMQVFVLFIFETIGFYSLSYWKKSACRPLSWSLDGGVTGYEHEVLQWIYFCDYSLSINRIPSGSILIIFCL